MGGLSPIWRTSILVVPSALSMISTIVILAFAGASALAGLLNVVPRYLPRYGMAPEWGRAIRPLELIYTAVACAITVIFNANVDAQGSAYATGVLVIMTSAAFAVMLSALWNDNSLRATLAFGLVTLIFLYTWVANILERPDGIKIASFFIACIIVVSLASRVRRSLALRQERIEIDEKAKRFIVEASKGMRSTSSPTAAASQTTPKSTPGSWRIKESTTASQRACLSCFWRSKWKIPRSSRRKCLR